MPGARSLKPVFRAFGGVMTQPNFISRIRNAQWPVQANNDGKDYFIFQILDDQGAPLMFCTTTWRCMARRT